MSNLGEVSKVLFWLKNPNLIQQVVDDLLTPGKFPPPTSCYYYYKNDPCPPLELDPDSVNPIILEGSFVYLTWLFSNVCYIQIVITELGVEIDRGYNIDYWGHSLSIEMTKNLSVNSYIDWCYFLKKFSQWFEDIKVPLVSMKPGKEIRT